MRQQNAPDVYDPNVVTLVLCPSCGRKTHYALNTDRYVCAVHGPVTTGEVTYPKSGRS